MRINTFIITTLLTAACFAGAIGVSAQSGRLGTSQWNLFRAGGRDYPNSTAYFEINAAGTKFTGSTGCNRMNGEFWRSGERIAFSKVATTRMLCELTAGSVPETLFMRHLKNVYRYRIVGNRMKLYDRRSRTILEFRRPVKMAPQEPGEIVMGSARLENRRWVLESTGNRKTLKAIEGAFINFEKKKQSVGGNSGCNSFGGEYKATNTTIKVKNVISTMMACLDGDKMEVERLLYDGLRQANRFEIKNDRLQLFQGKTLLLTFRPEPK